MSPHSFAASISTVVYRLYGYVGPEHLCTGDHSAGVSIGSEGDLRDWLSRQDEWRDDLIEVTFVVTSLGVLRVAPRRSEHVDCAMRGPVQAAGELTMRLKPRLEVVAATNQSTGYCPEPGCWEAARAALAAIGVPHLRGLTHAYNFRLCNHCGERNLIKDGWFECGSCGHELPREWNFAAPAARSTE